MAARRRDRHPDCHRRCGVGRARRIHPDSVPTRSRARPARPSFPAELRRPANPPRASREFSINLMRSPSGEAQPTPLSILQLGATELCATNVLTPHDDDAAHVRAPGRIFGNP
ncbi:hypothetical protein Bamb_1443 [Burkholderia ambifaria AMMD]|uniref:Uncharacterized protein n=1 Tax=Burkholderia ambifaria (strain ATCC BAA-244 / DSM 16087 / CCUG 44356 / LMG 19182 / AMMD) TaxID=339670 RepID=Q0BFS2_BURCM|nr:hypothetical protein Bamb_1443 [Burkholderia ambifaria AMMD]